MTEITIILPVHNVEKYIAKSIQSVLNQTFTDFELLIVIDGSPDNSKQIAEEFAVKDQRIKVFEKENGGLSDARNYGLERARGEYVYFMDSDDWIEPDLLEDNLKIIEQENLDLIIFGYIQDDENKEGKVTNLKTFVPQNKTYHKSAKNLNIDNHLLGILGYAWNKIYRKDFLNKHHIRFKKGISLVEDILFNSEVYCKTNILRTVDKAYYHYLNRPATTLIKKFYPDSFQLKLAKNEALKRFMQSWSVDKQQQNQILAYGLVHGIRYCVHNLFAYQNGWPFKKRMAYVKNMVHHPETRRLIPFYRRTSRSCNIYYWLIKLKMYRSIAGAAQMLK